VTVSGDELRSLLLVAPAEFVAARNALAASWKAAGRRDDASSIRSLRRPGIAEHALNLVAARRPDVAAVWADAIGAVEQQQSAAIGSGAGDALRSATVALRTATVALVDVAVDELGDGGQRHRSDVIDTVRALSNGPGAAQVRHGLVGSEQLVDVDWFADTPEPPSRVRAARPERPRPEPVRRRAPQPEAAADTPPPRPRPARPDPTVVRRLDAKLERLRQRVQRLEHEVADARHQLAEAEERLVAAQSDAAAARDERAALDRTSGR
jgi:hypothetical protein